MPYHWERGRPMIDEGMSSVLDTLLASGEPAIRHKAWIALLGEDPTTLVSSFRPVLVATRTLSPL
jgi:hypothetical protein